MIIAKHSQNKKFFTSMVVAVFTSLFLVAFVSASTRGVSFEAEEGANLTECTKVISTSSASSGQALEFDCPEQEGFVHPGVVYSQSDIDSWSTSSPEYTRLAGTCAGTISPTSGSCLTRNPAIVYGTRIDSGGNTKEDGKDPDNELNRGLKDQSGFAKVQAVLWAADNNTARRSKVISYLQEFRTVTSFEWAEGEQYRLVAGWSCTSLAQAAEIINYQDDQFKRFLGEVCWPLLDWPGATNWQASFADSRLSIAAYLSDEQKWQEAKAYFYKRLKQNIYYSAYDGNKVFPIHSQDTTIENITSGGTKVGTVTITRSDPTGTVHVGRTQGTWGSGWGIAQINSDLTFNTGVYGPPVDGINAERNRDLSHINMAFTAWVHGARTILAQGEQLEEHAYNRLKAASNYHAERCLAYIQTGEIPFPVPYGGAAGGGYLGSWESLQSLLGSDTPQTVISMLDRSEVKNRAAAGYNHMVAELFAD